MCTTLAHPTPTTFLHHVRRSSDETEYGGCFTINRRGGEEWQERETSKWYGYWKRERERERERERVREGERGRMPCDSCGGEPAFCQESMKLTP